MNRPPIRPLLILVTIIGAGALQACSLFHDPFVDLEKTCKKNMRVIVHDQRLWDEYRAESEAIHRRELAQNPPIRWRQLYVSAGDFEIRYGAALSKNRWGIEDNKIVRNDLFVVKYGKPVAQIVDYVYHSHSIDGPLGGNCLKHYDNLIIGKRDGEI